MSTLKTLKDKDPKEVARLLSAISRILLPNPGVEDLILQNNNDPELVGSVLTEIRNRLQVLQTDRSVKTQSRIYALLSEEMSKAALVNADIEGLKTRIGDKGELHPSLYKVEFTKDIEKFEGLGVRRSHIIEAITHPDHSMNIRPKLLQESRDPRVTLSIKFVTPNRVEDRFILIIISQRRGYIQTAELALRAYFSNVDLSNANDPLSVLRSLVDAYGMPFVLEDNTYNFICNEVLEIDSRDSKELAQSLRTLDVQKNKQSIQYVVGGTTNLINKDGKIMGEIVLAFVLDSMKYVETLRKHKVPISPLIESFLR